MMRFLVFGICVVLVDAQDKLVCLGNEFVTRIVGTVLDRNREMLARNEPNSLGEYVENIGLFVLQNARLYNLSGTQLHGSIIADCVSDPTLVKLRIAVSNVEYVFIYDYIFPGHLTYGKVIITSDYFGQVFYIESPSDARSTERTLLTDIEFYRSDDFKLSFTGLGPVTRALSTAMWAAYRLVPQLPLQLYKSLAIRVIQNYIDENPLPL